MLLLTQSIQGMKRPPRRDQNSVSALVVNQDDMLNSEADWIRRSDDLGVISPNSEHGWLNGVVEDVIAKVSRRLYLVSVFSPSEKSLLSIRKRSSAITDGIKLIVDKHISTNVT